VLKSPYFLSLEDLNLYLPQLKPLGGLYRNSSEVFLKGFSLFFFTFIPFLALIEASLVHFLGLAFSGFLGGFYRSPSFGLYFLCLPGWFGLTWVFPFSGFLFHWPFG